MVPPGSRVLDPCLGSGTTDVAALMHRCEFVGIDVDPRAVSESGARLAEVEEELQREGVAVGPRPAPRRVGTTG
jgi:DNA modification methylase